ncbi:Lectin BRA-3 [Amphibalanus amphitrite]|uniref:Lectin BRA-3 n=1 Tax=Amphibalanus amphitrite TaxID=1232801 RepID=A0A6A4XCC9_AMPAM|nr:Lectin BRA-3 [Amphibalanus amphitrite]
MEQETRVPLVQLGRRQPPWFDRELRAALREKEAAHRRMKKARTADNNELFREKRRGFKHGSTVSCACPGGFSRCAGRCLIRPPQELGFTEAKAACVSLGAHLAVPRSAEENQCVLTMAAGVDVWIGLSEHGEDGVFVAEDGGEPMTTVDIPFWGAGEPNNRSTVNCMQIWQNAWDDTDCDWPQKFMCQLRLWNRPDCA